MAINLPIFKDTNTPSPFREDFSVLGDDGSSTAAAKVLDEQNYLTKLCGKKLFTVSLGISVIVLSAIAAR